MVETWTRGFSVTETDEAPLVSKLHPKFGSLELPPHLLLPFTEPRFSASFQSTPLGAGLPGRTSGKRRKTSLRGFTALQEAQEWTLSRSSIRANSTQHPSPTSEGPTQLLAAEKKENFAPGLPQSPPGVPKAMGKAEPLTHLCSVLPKPQERLCQRGGKAWLSQE